MKAFSEVLVQQLWQKTWRRFLLAFVLLILGSFAIYAFATAQFLKVEADHLLKVAQTENEVAGRLSSETISEARKLCQARSCEELVLINNDSRRIEYSFPNESVIGSTVINLFKKDTTFALSWRFAQFGWRTRKETLVLTQRWFHLLELPFFLAMLLTASAGGFLLASRRSAHKVSKLFSVELRSLTALAKPTFLTQEGVAIYRLLLQQRDRLQQLSQVEAEARSATALARQAEQIAHDIRSPLLALSTVLSSKQNLDESKREILSAVVERIQSIAQSLLKKSRELDAGPSSRAAAPLSELLLALLDEKVILAGDAVHLHSQVAADLEAFCEPLELGRIVSNLINNSLEAGSSQIRLSARSEAQSVVIEIEDNGRGIPPERIPDLMQRGASFGKKDGHGLGLYYAKQRVQGWNGRIELRSEVGRGTKIVMVLPGSSAGH